MIALRTRRISSSLLPLNMTPATTSIHPPVWWKGPLGPLTTGRDLYAVRPHATVGRIHPGAADEDARPRGHLRGRGENLDPGVPPGRSAGHGPLDRVRPRLSLAPHDPARH